MRSLFSGAKLHFNPHSVFGLAWHLVSSEVHQVQLGLEGLALETVALLVESEKWVHAFHCLYLRDRLIPSHMNVTNVKGLFGGLRPNIIQLFGGWVCQRLSHCLFESWRVVSN